MARTLVTPWKARDKLFGGATQKLSCYPDAPISEKNGLIDITPKDCPKGIECCLKAPLTSRPADLKVARNALKPHTDRREVALRGKAIRQLEKHPTSLMGPSECRALGDAYFVLFCPAKGMIITTNIRDIEPMATALGVKFEAP